MSRETLSEPAYRLRLVDGRYLRCYLWSSKRAIFTETGDGPEVSWWGTMRAAHKIQDEWGAASCPLQLVPKETT